MNHIYNHILLRIVKQSQRPLISPKGQSLILYYYSLNNQLCENNPHMFNSVRCLLTGGDVISTSAVSNILIHNPNINLVN